MAIDFEQRRFTVDEYLRMAASGVFEPSERVELLEVHREPSDRGFGARTILGPGDSISLLALPDVPFAVIELSRPEA